MLVTLSSPASISTLTLYSMPKFLKETIPPVLVGGTFGKPKIYCSRCHDYTPMSYITTKYLGVQEENSVFEYWCTHCKLRIQLYEKDNKYIAPTSLPTIEERIIRAKFL